MIKKKRATTLAFFVREFLKIRLKIHVNCGQIFRYFGAKYGADLIEFLIRMSQKKSAKLYRKIVKENWGKERAKIKH